LATVHKESLLLLISSIVREDSEFEEESNG
jgi:hypothetical protein